MAFGAGRKRPTLPSRNDPAGLRLWGGELGHVRVWIWLFCRGRWPTPSTCSGTANVLAQFGSLACDAFGGRTLGDQPNGGVGGRMESATNEGVGLSGESRHPIQNKAGRWDLQPPRLPEHG